MRSAVSWMYPPDDFVLFNDLSKKLRGETSDIHIITITYASFCMQLPNFIIFGIITESGYCASK